MKHFEVVPVFFLFPLWIHFISAVFNPVLRHILPSLFANVEMSNIVFKAVALSVHESAYAETLT